MTSPKVIESLILRKVAQGGDVATLGAEGGDGAKWQGSTAVGCPQNKDAWELNNVGERAVTTWQAGPNRQ